jgi:hypothetical protein
MTTTAGLTRPTTLTKSFCSAPAIVGDDDAEAVGEALAAGEPDAIAPDPQATARNDPPSRSAPRRGSALLPGVRGLALGVGDVWFMSVPPLMG